MKCINKYPEIAGNQPMTYGCHGYLILGHSFELGFTVLLLSFLNQDIKKMRFLENIKWKLLSRKPNDDDDSDEEKETNSERRESRVTISTVETYLEDIETAPDPIKLPIDQKNRTIGKSKHSNNFFLQFYYNHYNKWSNIAICVLLATGIGLPVAGQVLYWMKIPFASALTEGILNVLGIFIIMFAISLTILKCVVHFSSANERGRVLPYARCYQTDQGYLSIQEIARRETGTLGSTKPTPGPDHFF